MDQPVCLIVNPSAGGGRAARAAPEAERALAEHGITVRRVDTTDLEHARSLALAAASAGEAVAALSGDGMVGAIADVLRSVPGALLAVLPGGRGNDLARVLGIPADLRAACANVAQGSPREMDVGEVIEEGAEGTGRTFVGIASAGFDSDANRIANEAPSWLGGLVYAYGALRALGAWRPARFELRLEPSGEHHTFVGYSVIAANSKAYGGGMLVAPDALLDDGRLEVIAIERVSKLRFLANLPKVFKGEHVHLPTVKVLRAEQVAISADRPFTMYADGDPIGDLPLRVRAVRGAVRVIVPDGPSDAFASPLPRPASDTAVQELAGGPPASEEPESHS